MSIENASSTSTGQLVDRFGYLKAQIADRSRELDDIKAELIARIGESKAEGEVFRIALSNSLRSSTDWKAVAFAMAKRAGVSDKVFDATVADNTVCTPMWVAKCNARITKGGE